MSTDSEIIRRARDNPRAFAELYDRHARVVTRFAIARVGGDAADDVVSETFLTAYRKLNRFDTNYESALPWLFGIATRILHRHRATEAKQFRAIQTASRVHQEADSGGDADDRLDAAFVAKELAPRIAKLPQRDLARNGARRDEPQPASRAS